MLLCLAEANGGSKRHWTTDHRTVLSEWIEYQVPESMANRMVPVQNAMLPGYLLRPLEYQLCHLVEVPRKENGGQ